MLWHIWKIYNSGIRYLLLVFKNTSLSFSSNFFSILLSSLFCTFLHALLAHIPHSWHACLWSWIKHIDELQQRVTEGAICYLERLGAKGISVTQEAYFFKGFPFSSHLWTLFLYPMCVCVGGGAVRLLAQVGEKGFLCCRECFILACAPCHCAAFQFRQIKQNSGSLWLLCFSECPWLGG